MDKIQTILYALAYINLVPLPLSAIVQISYDGFIGNRMFHTRITIDKYKDVQVRQELYRAKQYENPRQDAGGFYFNYHFIRGFA